MRIKVSVTRGDISKGKTPAHGWAEATCPVERAINRTVEELTGVNTYVAATSRVISGREMLTGKPVPERLFEVNTPRSVARFIKAFDANKKVKPFNFFLNV